MNRNAIRAIAVGTIAAPVVAVAAAGAASAFPTADVVGGRERAKVTITNDRPTLQNCSINIGGRLANLAVQPSGGRASIVVGGLAPGANPVSITCPSGGLIYTAPVNVAPGNPGLDAVDGVLKGAGSSALATDPALR